MVSQKKPILLVPIDKAKKLLDKQIKEGKQLRNLKINSLEKLKKAEEKRKMWHDYNCALLEKFFSNSSISDEYIKSDKDFTTKVPTPFFEDPFHINTFENELNHYKETISRYITKLKSIKNRLNLYTMDNNKETKINKMQKSNKIFIVHGRDDGTKQVVNDFIKKIGLNPIILHEQANKGKTIIEKFEEYSDVGYAIILLTPDDEGKLKSEKELKERARQNVIFEFGFFVGKLGRNKVCALHKGKIELPSDLNGIVYIDMDNLKEPWNTKLAKELKAVGFKVNLNNVI